ncbi:anti-sigma factor family protein [Nonomuraea lactucae]|uniref:anti-sigma factor family protein n=1 Tax=Nonomuraea lactucae TaxID=2249762 RepID=UPI000DE34757|nr:zf-HC2 domain-containing protein [Nonomuraea lactucae]
MTTCEEVRLALGAHALGALDPDEALQIDLHLATCEVCGAELVELEGVSAFLGKVSEHDVELVASPPSQVLDRLLSNARAKRHRRRRVLLAVAASVAAVAVGGAVWGAVVRDTPVPSAASAPAADTPAGEPNDPFAAQDGQARRPELKREVGPGTVPSPSASARKATGREFSAENDATESYATVTAFPGRDRTGLSVRVSGVPVGTTCKLVVVGRDGRRDMTESWTVVPQTYVDNLVYERETRIPMSAITRFDVVDSSGKVLVRIPVPQRK